MVALVLGLCRDKEKLSGLVLFSFVLFVRSLGLWNQDKEVVVQGEQIFRSLARAVLAEKPRHKGT